MARIRTIKPSFFRHLKLFKAESETGLPLRVAYAGLWTAADRDGRFRWEPEELKLDCLPFDNVDFSRVLDALWTRGFIVKYAVDGREYGCIPSWKEHQAINNRENASHLPECNETNMLTRDERVDDATTTRHDPAPVEGKGREGKGTDIRTRADAARPDVSEDFQEFWKEYPKREGPNPRKTALQRYENVRKRGVNHETIMAGLRRYVSGLTSAGQIGTRFVKQAETWLNQECWADHADVEGAPERIEVYSIKLDTPEWEAWYAYTRENGQKFVHSQMTQIGNIGVGQMAFRSRWPPDYKPPEAHQPQEHAA